MKRSKVVSPCMGKGYTRSGNVIEADAFCEITLEDGRLSITGVIGPKNNGDCSGSAGQCVDEIRKGRPVAEWGWNDEMLQKFCDIWDMWHLNDMRAYCHHMKELGWTELFQEKVKVAKWDVTREARDKARDAEKRALECLKNGETFVPTLEETMNANLGYGVTMYNDETPEHPEFYELKERDCLGHSNIEYKTRGWISHKDHELGFLGKKCPVCGYGYGTAWIKEEVPEDVIEWLFALPDAYKTPAWV